MKPAKRKPSPSKPATVAPSANITRTVIPLPPGWEAFEVAPSGRPEGNWLSAPEFACGRMDDKTARRILKAAVDAGRMEKCVRIHKGNLTTFYRPLA